MHRPSSRSDTRSSFVAMNMPTNVHDRPKAYKGRIKRWPGVVLLITIVAGATTGIIYFANKVYQNSVQENIEKQKEITKNRRIGGPGNGDGPELPDIVSDDGQVGNPTKYSSQCVLPNYISKNGKIYVQFPDKTEIPITIKGINWFGMETSHVIPFGMWDNQQNGTTAYEIATFLARNKFNSVRLPISIKNVLSNAVPDRNFINTQTNRAISVLNHASMISSIVQSLGYRNITVMISIHTLTPNAVGGLWYDNSLGIGEEDTLEVITILAEQLCNDKHWNVIGLDLKNEPHLASWGSGPAGSDWLKGSETLGNHMLAKCPQWITFIEGINSAHTTPKGIAYYDWWGGGLQNAADGNIPKLSIPNKIIWAPHYYTPSVHPQPYMFQPGFRGEKSDANLKDAVIDVWDHMFGHLVDDPGTDAAIVLGEFGGIYGTDKHPNKTNQRVVNYCIEEMKKEGYAGGYMWSLNPESKYDYNPMLKKGFFTEGLVMDNWLDVNQIYLEGLSKMDDMPDLKQFPCYIKPTSKSKSKEK